MRAMTDSRHAARSASASDASTGSPDERFEGLALTLAPVAGPGGDVRAALGLIARAGFEAVQLSAGMPGLRPRELDRSARRDLVSTMRRRELTAAGIDCWVPLEHFTDPVHADRAAAAVMQTIDLASDLGRVPLSLHLPDPGPVLDALIAHAAVHGVTLADHGPWTMEPAAVAGDDGDEDDTDPRPAGPPVGVGIDAAAWIAQGLDPAAGAMRHASSMASLRLVDLDRSGMRRPIGGAGGRVDVLALRAATEATEYRGPLVIDARQWPEPVAMAADAARAWLAAGPGGRGGR